MRTVGNPQLAVSALFFLAPFCTCAATFQVTHTGDGGVGSLRQAMLDANATPGPDSIHFAIPGAGPHTIQPGSALPGITDTLTIDGYTQPGAGANTAATGSNAVIRIEIRGPGLGGFSGFSLLNGSANSIVRGLAINRFGLHFNITLNATACIIAGNFIGTDPTGTIGYPGPAPSTQTGMTVAAEGCRIGGTTRADRNVVSGISGTGIHVSGDGVFVQGNLIGTDRVGGTALGNNCGVVVDAGALDATIGGLNSGVSTPRNVISGNTRCGIELASGDGHVVEGNLIGLAAFPILTIPNNGPGIRINGANGVRIGTGTSGEISNAIAGNDGPGVLVTSGGGGPSRDIAIFGNAIFGNDGLAIDLALNGQSGVTPNDPLDGDDGPNTFQNFPVLTQVSYGETQTIVRGTLASTPSQSFYIDLYQATNCHPSGHGGANSYIDYLSVNTDAGGNASFEFTIDDVLDTGYATATATQNTGGDSTSEFSRCLKLGDVLFQDGFEPLDP